MWKKLKRSFLLCIWFALWPYCGSAQDAGPPREPLLQALRILESSGEHMNSLEDSIRASSRITNDLLSKTAAMRTIINQQRTQSAADLANYRKSQEAWKNESASYEATIASLSQSYRDLQIEREAEKERADTLEKKNLRKTIAIVILSAVMAIILAALIVIVFRRK